MNLTRFLNMYIPIYKTGNEQNKALRTKRQSTGVARVHFRPSHYWFPWGAQADIWESLGDDIEIIQGSILIQVELRERNHLKMKKSLQVDIA